MSGLSDLQHALRLKAGCKMPHLRRPKSTDLEVKRRSYQRTRLLLLKRHSRATAKVKPTPVASMERPSVVATTPPTTTASTIIRVALPGTTHDCEQFQRAARRVLGERHYAMTQALYQGICYILILSGRC